MKKLKVTPILLAACLSAGFCVLPAFAQEGADSWDGTSDTSWYQEDRAEFEIHTAEQLAGLAVLVNSDISFDGKTVKLTADMDLGGHEWISIGSGANTLSGAFQGIFDGQNHVIYNLYSHEDTTSENKDNNLYRNGLFGCINGAVIQNIGVENADIRISPEDTSTYGKGILVDWMTDSVLKNCYTTGSITGGSYVEKYIGGIAGFLNGDNQITGCYSTAEITGNYDGGAYDESDPYSYWDSLGGIAGASYTGDTAIRDCWFGGRILVHSIQAPVGGIIGYCEGTTIFNCMVATDKLGSDGLGNTCWLAYSTDLNAEQCCWKNDPRYPATPANEESGVSAGTPVDDFREERILSGLQDNAGEGTEWVAGIANPTFIWDEVHLPADYTAVHQALAAIPDDLSLYTEESVSALKTAVEQVLYDKSVREQEIVDGYAAAIEEAAGALKYRAADYSAVDAAIERANALNRDDYVDFSAVENAVSAVVRGKNITEQDEVDAMAKSIEQAIAGLEKRLPDAAAGNPDTGDSGIPILCALTLLGALSALAGSLAAGSRERCR